MFAAFINSKKSMTLNVKKAALILPLAILMFAQSADATTDTLISGSTYTVPAQVSSLDVVVIGAGGGGAGGASTFGGGAGGAGFISTTTISVVPGQVISYTIGVGGNGGAGAPLDFTTSPAGNGSNGGDTTFDTISANGGLGGTGAAIGVAIAPGGDGSIVGGDGTQNNGGNGGDLVVGTTTIGVGGIGGTGSASTFTLPTAGANGSGGGAGSGWAGLNPGQNDNGANGGNGFIILNYVVNSTSSTSTDTIAPVITILGNNPATTTVGTAYIDAGATSTDNVDGNITANIIASSTVNTSATGTYSVVYTVSDAAGNSATATRVVNVLPVGATSTPDTIAPVITILGSNPITILQGSVYNDALATALDNVDGNITTSIVVTNNLNVFATGTYSYNYSVTDSSGNTASSSRIIHVVSAPDTIAPVITILGNNPATTTLGSLYVDAGATSTDNVDGDITANIVASSSVNINATGTYSVIYTVADGAGNVATATRTVIVIPALDTTAPVITILGSNPVTVVVGSVYTDAGATSTDNVDGNITANIATSTNLNINATGTYQFIYTVSDAAGNVASSTRIIHVVSTPDTIVPVITILGNNPATTTVGSVYTDAGATATDNIDGNITSNIISSSTVNTSATGTYSVFYTVTDGAGNIASSTRTVIVVATSTNSGGNNNNSGPVSTGGTVYTGSGSTGSTGGSFGGTSTTSTSTSSSLIPTITLNGQSEVAVGLGANYIDPGVTATDAVDGNITSRVTTTGFVNTNIIGTYFINYSVQNSRGYSITVTRTVYVVDPSSGFLATNFNNNNGGSNLNSNSSISELHLSSSTLSEILSASTSSSESATSATSGNSTSTSFVGTVFLGLTNGKLLLILIIILAVLLILYVFYEDRKKEKEIKK